MTQTVEKIDYHRNGVGGMGFHVAILKEDGRNMLVVRFPKEADKDAGAILCAAFDLALLAEGVIEFGHNSWRGDHYNEVVDKRIAADEAAFMATLRPANEMG